MPYFRIDDKLHSHRKTMRASVGAMGLWALAGSWCMDQRTDGWVPSYAATRLDRDAETHAAELVAAGYWHPEKRDGDEGWVFHEWDTWQHSADYIEERRRRNRERMRRARGGRPEQTAKTERPAENLEPTPPPKPKRTKPAEPDGWGDFWQAYPRKVGKTAAHKAYTKAVRDADPAAILAGVRAAASAWRALETEAQFIPHPASWLNAGRWEDEPQLPNMPVGGNPAVRRATLAQCTEPEPHPGHRWEQGRNLFHCQGVQ